MRGKKLIQKKRRYKRLKRTCWALFFTILIIYLAIFFYMYLGSRGPAPGEHFITRTTPRTVVLTGSEVPVNLLLEPSLLTTLPPVGGRPLDILIALDNSLSISIAGREKTLKDVALGFLEKTDLDKHQVGIARLDSDARVVQGLSHNRRVLRNVIREIQWGGSTSIHDGLAAMNAEFNSIRRRPGSLGVAIILSDGRSNAKKSLREAAGLKQQQGVFIAPIGIGQHVDDGLMTNIASWPSEYRKVGGEKTENMLEQLDQIYLDWTKILEQLVAVDVQVTEYYNHTGLKLINKSANLGGVTDPDARSIQWKLPFLTSRPVSLQYTQNAGSILWHQLDRAVGTVSFKPVGIEAKEVPIHPKPKVIILSPLLLLLLLFLLFLPLLPLLIAWIRRLLAARGTALLPEEIPNPDAFPAPPFLPPLQLDKLVRSTEPTLVIGLGGTGRWVLTHLKKAVMETNYGRLPKTLKFLLLDTYERELLGDGSPAVRTGGVQLEEEEFLILDEDAATPEKLLERTRRLSESPGSAGSEPHLNDWWPARAFKELTAEAFKISTGTKKRRPIGRLSLFLDLEKGREESRFYTRTGSLLKELDNTGKGVNVFIASSLCGGMGGGMFTDIAYLVRHIAESEGVRGVTVHANLALHNTFGAFGDSLGLTVPNTFAALRELDRFLSCRNFRFPMNYSPQRENPINGRLNAPLLDNCYLFDGERNPRPLHKERPELGVFPSMADSIHTFLYNTAGGAFDQEVRQRKAVGELERVESGHGVACSLGTFVYRLPMFDFVQTFKYRFAGEITADLFGMAQEKGQWVQAPLSGNDIQLLDQLLENFLQEEGPDRGPSDILNCLARHDPQVLPAIVEADRAARDKENYVNLHRVNYGRTLAQFLMNLLNGGDGTETLEKGKRYSAALHLLRQLESMAGDALDRQKGGGRDGAVAALLLEQVHQVTAETRQQLQNLGNTILDGHRGTGAQDNTGNPSPEEKENRLPLLKYLENKEERQLQSRETDRSILVREYLYNQNMEQKLYDDNLGPKIRSRHLPRFVWHCTEQNGQPQVRLNLAADRLRPIEPNAGTGKNAETITLLPEILLQELWNMDITPYLETAYPDAAEVAANVHDKSTPLILFEKNMAPRHTRKIFLSLGESDYRGRLVRNLGPNYPNPEHVKGTPFRDAHAFSAVSVLDALPLTAIRPYEQARKKYLALDADQRLQLHVFAAEQNAVRYEARLPVIKEPGQAFHPRFISHLQHNALTRLFARCHLAGLLPNLLQYNVEKYKLDIPATPGPTPCILAQREHSHMPTPLDALHAFIRGEGKNQQGETMTIPTKEIENFVENHPPSRQTLADIEKQLMNIKSDADLPTEVKNFFSFIHLVLNEELNNAQAKE